MKAQQVNRLGQVILWGLVCLGFVFVCSLR